MWLEGRKAWPTIWPSNKLFVALVASRLNGGDAADDLDASELYIAAACAAHDSQAICAFEEKDFTGLRLRLGAMMLSSTLRGEVTQMVRE